MALTLYPHQQAILDRNPSKHLLAHGTGSGKTITSLSLAEKNAKTCLIIVPKALSAQWQRAIGAIENRKCEYFIISKETFKRDCTTLPHFQAVIVDEGHYFAGEKSQLTKSLRWFLKKQDVPYVWIATATPYLSTPMNIYTLARHLGHDWNYMSFRREFFDEVRMGHRFIPKVKKGIEQKLRALVLEIGSTVDLEDIVEVPTQSFTTEYFTLTQEQEKAITELQDTEFITRFTHRHCIENGVLYGDGYTATQTFASLKVDRLIELATQHSKLAVVCRYNGQIATLQALLTSLGYTTLIVDGSSSGQDRDAIIQKANSLEKVILLIQASCSEGYELPTFDTCVFMSLSFSYKDYHQLLGRFLRINRLKENHYIHLVSEGVDTDIYKCIMNKQDFSFTIYGKDPK